MFYLLLQTMEYAPLLYWEISVSGLSEYLHLPHCTYEAPPDQLLDQSVGNLNKYLVLIRKLTYLYLLVHITDNFTIARACNHSN